MSRRIRAVRGHDDVAEDSGGAGPRRAESGAPVSVLLSESLLLPASFIDAAAVESSDDEAALELVAADALDEITDRLGRPDVVRSRRAERKAMAIRVCRARQACAYSLDLSKAPARAY
jgi:hypothetical protein